MESFYPGESARGARERSKNHMAAYRGDQKDSFMFKYGQGAERPEANFENRFLYNDFEG